MTADRAGWWAGDAASTRHTARTTRSASTAGSRDPTRAARGSRTACTAPAASSTPRAAPGATAAGPAAAGPGRAGGCSTSCTSARSRPRARSTRAAERLDHLVELGVDVVELMPVAAFDGTLELGLRRGRPVRGARAVRRPRRPAAVRRRRATAAAWASASTWSTTTWARRGTTSSSSARTSPTRHHTPWGAAVNLDGPGSDEVRRWIIDNALRWFADFHVDALRLDAVHALRDDRRGTCSPSCPTRSPRSRRALGRPLTLIAESDLNDTVMRRPDRRGRPRHGRAVGRRRAPRAPRRR